MSKSQAWLDAVALVGTLVSIALGLWAYATLPPSIATRFGADGAVGYGPKGTVLLLPLFAVLGYVAAGFQAKARSPKLNLPFAINDANREAIYALAGEMALAIRAALGAGFAAIEWQIVCSAQGRLCAGFLPTILVFIAVVFGVVGGYIYRMSKA